MGRLLCFLGFHERQIALARGGYVRFVSCLRCNRFTMVKGQRW